MIPFEELNTNTNDQDEAWKEAILEDLIEDAIGGAWGDDPAKASSDQVIVRVIRGTEFRNWDKEKGSTAATRAIDQKSFARRMLTVGDMVVEISGGGPSQPVGRTLVIDQEALDSLGGRAISSNFCRRVRFKADVNPFFVDNALKLKYSLGELNQFQTETTNIRNLTFPKFISETSIPLPTREVQDQLVMMIGGLQAQIGQVRDHLATIPALLKKFRQSVLAAAYDGSVLEGTEGLMLAPKVLRDVVDRIEAGKSFRAEGFPPRDGEPGVIKVSAMTWGEFDPRESKKLLPGTKPNPRTEIKSGDLLFSRANTEELVGATVLVKSTPPNLYLSDKSLRLVTSPGVSRAWLNIVLSAPQVREYFADSATGTSNSMRNISQAKLLITPLLVPEPKVQEQIANRVESLFALVDSIESRLAEATAQVERTTQAILAKAFRGEL